jgi:hypothetical protein
VCLVNKSWQYLREPKSPLWSSFQVLHIYFVALLIFSEICRCAYLETSPWKRIGELKCVSVHSSPGYWMRVTCQLHALAFLSPERDPSIHCSTNLQKFRLHEEVNTSTSMKMVATGSSERLILIYRTTWRTSHLILPWWWRHQASPISWYLSTRLRGSDNFPLWRWREQIPPKR